MRQPCRAAGASSFSQRMPLGRANAIFAFRLDLIQFRSAFDSSNTLYTKPHPAGQIERLRFVPRRLMGLVVIPRPAVAGGIAERSLERRHARCTLSKSDPQRGGLPCATRAPRR